MPPSGRSLQDEPQLTLYHYPTCPFCIVVERAIARTGVRPERRNILASSAARRELVQAMGRATVPVLRIEHADGTVRWLPESRDIAAFLHDSTGTAPVADSRARAGLLWIGAVLFASWLPLHTFDSALPLLAGAVLSALLASRVPH